LNFGKRTQQPDRLGGRYQVVSQLGVGGFSQTFLAQDLHLPGHPLCVVKQFKPQIDDPAHLPAARRLFDTEAKVLYQLGEHPQIPRLLAHFEEDEEFYLVQEFVEGEPLAKLLTSSISGRSRNSSPGQDSGQNAQQNPGQNSGQNSGLTRQWTEQQVVALLRDILQILTFVHAQSVIHRDIKPSNLIYRQDGRIVLIDFGAVKQVSTQLGDPKFGHSLTISIGTQGYMPIEQLSGTPRFSSDIYAVGIVGIQALTGISPKRFTQNHLTGELEWRSLPRFRANDQPHQVSNGPSDPPHSRSELEPIQISPEFAAILDRMVCYHFKDRYQTAAEALEALEELVRSRLEWVEGASYLLDESSNDGLKKTLIASDLDPLDPAALPITSSDEAERLSQLATVDFLRDASASNGAPLLEDEPGEVLEPVLPTILEPVAFPTAPPENGSQPTSTQENSQAEESELTSTDLAADLATELNLVQNPNDLAITTSAASIEQPTEEQLIEEQLIEQQNSSVDSAFASELSRLSSSEYVLENYSDSDYSDSATEVSSGFTESLPYSLESGESQLEPELEHLKSPLSESAQVSSEPEWYRRSLFKLSVVSVVAAVIAIPVLSQLLWSQNRTAQPSAQPPAQPTSEQIALKNLPCREPTPPALPSTEPDYEYENGTRFYGEIEQGEPVDGKAIMVFPSGNRYDGEFRQGQRNGCGTLTFASGKRYMGQFKDDKFNGQGLWTLETGDRYVGAFQDNRCHGRGIFISKDGTLHSGEWQNGKQVDGNFSCD
jgi:serine/threonine protein kinase